MGNTKIDSLTFKSGYSDVNGLKMYYEIYGEGKPLMLIHGGGSTIQTTFGRVIPMLAKHRKLIAVELQAHGRTGDKDVITPEHAIEMHRLIANSELAIIPGGHGEYIGEITTLKPNYKERDFVVVTMIESFLDKKE
jgi:pimeloyl-ACP methyl ester carboxylesterase